MAGEEQVIAWMSNLVIIILLLIGLVATNLVWGVHWLWWVPPISRKITWLKRHRRSVVLLADDAGWINFDFPEEILPEGVYRMKDDNWHFLPRPHFQNPDGSPLTISEAMANQIVQRRFIWKEMGLPMWIGYIGKLPLANPMALAAASTKTSASLKAELETIVDFHTQELIKQYATPMTNPEEQKNTLFAILASLKVELQRSVQNAPGPTEVETVKIVNCDTITPYVKTLPVEFQPPLLKFLDGLNGNNAKPTPVTYIDNTDIKRMLPRAHTPTQAKAIARNRERYGELKANKSIWDKAMPIALVLGLGIVLIIVFALAYSWMHPTPAAKDLIFTAKEFLQFIPNHQPVLL